MTYGHTIKIGDILTLCRERTANRYGHGGTPTDLPVGTKARVLRVEKPFANQACHYVDIEFIGYTNDDGTPVRGGDWHAGTFGEYWDNFLIRVSGSVEDSSAMFALCAVGSTIMNPATDGAPVYFWRGVDGKYRAARTS
tara:strand:+ start:1218 stop:1634 length:417 start_codon:yes stop_codon:yes gene_type:complete